LTKEARRRKYPQWMVVINMANCFLLIACLFFSFACNFLKKIYEDQRYQDIFSMLCSVAVNGIAGFIFAIIVSEFFSNPVAIIGLSGIGGFFGIKIITSIMRSRICARLGFEDTDPFVRLTMQENERIIEETEERRHTQIRVIQ
jgi:uncharacterized protein YacL